MPTLHPGAGRLRRFHPAGAFYLRRCIVTLMIVIAWIAPLATPSGVDARLLGDGIFSVTATVFGTDADGMIGEESTSGRDIVALDRMVSLPACTESSCPWLSIFADPADKWGPQTACAETDGLCWVEITSELTGTCTVAPVLDLGPLFKTDNWWDARQNRTFDLKRGMTAAESALTGADLGFGAGITDTGLNVPRDYPDAASMGIAAGTWFDLGLDPDQGVSGVTVRLLWQDGTNHVNGCDGTFGNATTIDSVNLRAGPSTNDEILTVLKANHRLTIIDTSKNGFYRVEINGTRGWVHSEWAKPDGGESKSPIGVVTDEVNFRAGPGTGDTVYRKVPKGSVVVLTGALNNGFYPVAFQKKTGWISADWLDLGDDDAPGSGTTDGERVSTTDRVNFRAEPSLTADILSVLPVDTEVSRRGTEKNGFSPVTHNGKDGWVWSEYLGSAGTSEELVVLEDLNLRSGPSTSDSILLVMTAGAQVTVTGTAENGFLPVIHDGVEGWAFGEYLS